MWSRASHDLFGLTAEALRHKWETGVEEESKRKGILTDLNAALAANVKCLCTGRIWSYGYQNITHKPQLNVNDLEVLM